MTHEHNEFCHKDFTGQDFTDYDPAIFSDLTICGSCFAREGGMTLVFPAGMQDVVLKGCNLCNVDLSGFDSVTVEGGCHYEINVQNDREDWKGSKESPEKPVNDKYFLKIGLSIDPKHISSVPMTTSISQEVMEQLAIIGGEL